MIIYNDKPKWFFVLSFRYFYSHLLAISGLNWTRIRVKNGVPATLSPDEYWSEVGTYVCMILLSASADEKTDICSPHKHRSTNEDSSLWWRDLVAIASLYVSLLSVQNRFYVFFLRLFLNQMKPLMHLCHTNAPIMTLQYYTTKYNTCNNKLKKGY